MRISKGCKMEDVGCRTEDRIQKTEDRWRMDDIEWFLRNVIDCFATAVIHLKLSLRGAKRRGNLILTESEYEIASQESSKKRNSQ